MIPAQKLLFPGKLNIEKNNTQDTGTSENSTQKEFAARRDQLERAHIAHMRDLIFYVALLTEIALVIIDKSSFTNEYVSYFFRFTFVLTVAVVLMSDLDLKEWIFLGALLVVGFVSYRISGRNEFLRFTMFAAACHDVNYKRALQVFFYGTLAGCIALVMLAATGIFGTISLTMDYGREVGVETRYVLGFGHPNSLQAMYFELLLVGLYLFHERLKWVGYLVLLVLSGGLYLLTDSRTGLLLCGFAICLFWAGSSKRIRESIASYVLGAGLFLGSVYFSYWSAKNSYLCWRPWELVDTIDHKLNGRICELYWGTNAHAGALETWRLFSTRSAEEYFDMGIVRLFYWYGWIPALLVIALLAALIQHSYRTRNFALMVVIVSVAIYSIIEAHFISVYIGRNFLVIMLGAFVPQMLKSGLRKAQGALE